MILRHSFEPPDNARLAHLCGSVDEHLRSIEQALVVNVSRRNEFFRVEGPKAQGEAAMVLLQSLYEQATRPITAEQVQLGVVQAIADAARRGSARARRKPTDIAIGDAAAGPAPDEITLRTRRADLVGRTPNQRTYLRNILSHDITFGIGPAGTGKTFLAVACAVDALERSSVQRVILTRPAVEAGERLGFLPGDLAQKVDPYLRPLYDALYDLMGADKVAKAFEKGLLEVAPLAFMRGRTLNHAFVILDEAQNTTTEQMKMFLTRPAVEAGERLGFLPGDLAQKVDPYLRPLYDALYDLMGADKVAKAFEKGLLEVAPLAFMRGRTLNHAFVILDEAQNTTTEQMKMFLTRIGFGAKAVITGDVSQIDLPRGTESGLIDAERVLRRVRGIATTHFTSADVVRHPLVARIVEAYDAARSDEQA